MLNTYDKSYIIYHMCLQTLSTYDVVDEVDTGVTHETQKGHICRSLRQL